MESFSGKNLVFGFRWFFVAYVNKDSNHPPSITRNLPKGINRLLSDTNSSRELFDASAPPYQAALDTAGYTHYQLW